jgi:hypothetical protein
LALIAGQGVWHVVAARRRVPPPPPAGDHQLGKPGDPADQMPGVHVTVYEGRAFERPLRHLHWTRPLQIPIDGSVLPPGASSENASMRVAGRIVFPTPGVYTLYVDADDGGRLWLGGRQIVDAWPSEHLNQRLVPLGERTAGAVPFVFEATNATGAGWMALYWEGPGIERRPLQATDFIADPGAQAMAP